MGKPTAGISDNPLQRDETEPGYAAGVNAPRADLRSSSSFVRGSNLPTVRFVSFGAGAVVVFLFALHELPGLAYWLHLPIAVFYVLLIGATAVGFLVKRRWGRLMPREPRLDIEHMEPRVARREARLMLGRSAFRLLPPFAAIGVFTWLFLVQHDVKAVPYVVGFALIWNVISKPIWEAFVLPHLRRG